MKQRKQFVRKKQDTNFRRCQTWGVPIANSSTLSSNILDNAKAEKALQINAAKQLNNPNKVALDRKKKNQLLEVKKSIVKNEFPSTGPGLSQVPFEITPKTKKKILDQIKNKQPIDVVCFEFMISDAKFQKEVFSCKNLAENQIFINYLRKNIDKLLADADENSKWERDPRKPFDPDKALISKKKRRTKPYESEGVFKFKFGTLEIPKDVWVKVYSGGLPSLGRRSR